MKRDGTHRARLVALGYSQVQGIDFTENFAPVVNDETFIIGLTRMIVEIWIQCLWMWKQPFYMEILMKKFIWQYQLDLLKSIQTQSTKMIHVSYSKGVYGLCQAARQFWKKFVQEMNQLDFEINPADTCLLYGEDKSGTCMIIIYVDVMLVIGNNEIFEELKTKVEEVFSMIICQIAWVVKST